MKKISAILAVMLLGAALLVSCSDGKCDECGEPAYKVTKEGKEAMEELNIKIKDELCEEHFEDALKQAVMEKFSDHM